MTNTYNTLTNSNHFDYPRSTMTAVQPRMPTFQRPSPHLPRQPEEDYADEVENNGDGFSRESKAFLPKIPPRTLRAVTSAMNSETSSKSSFIPVGFPTKPPTKRNDDTRSSDCRFAGPEEFEQRSAPTPPAASPPKTMRGRRLFDEPRYRAWAVATVATYNCSEAFLSKSFIRQFGLPEGYDEKHLRIACRSIRYSSQRFAREVENYRGKIDITKEAPFALPGPRIKAISALIESCIAEGDIPHLKIMLGAIAAMQKELGIGTGRPVNLNINTGDRATVSITVAELLQLNDSQILTFNPADTLALPAARQAVEIARKAQLKMIEGAKASDIIDLEEMPQDKDIILPDVLQAREETPEYEFPAEIAGDEDGESK
jgi:hypothetical protein